MVKLEVLGPGTIPSAQTFTGKFFFFGFYKSRKRKLHYHDAMSKAIALVKAARPRCRALAFVSVWPTPVSVQSRFPNGLPLRWSAPRLFQPPVLLRLLPLRFFTRETWASAPRAGPPWSGLPLPSHSSSAQRCLPRARCQPPRLPWATDTRAEEHPSPSLG